MGRSCSICIDENRVTIDEQLVLGRSILGISGNYQVSEDDLLRHKRSGHILAEVVEGVNKRYSAETRNVLSRVDEIRYDLESLLSNLRDKSSLGIPTANET